MVSGSVTPTLLNTNSQLTISLPFTTSQTSGTWGQGNVTQYISSVQNSAGGIVQYASSTTVGFYFTVPASAISGTFIIQFDYSL
jgi:hypothetical protein